MTPLGKIVSQRGALSRRLAAVAIRRGRVTVDGEVVNDPRQRIDATQAQITLDDAPLGVPPDFVVWHKPIGVHCTLRDGRGRPCLTTEAPDLLDLGLHPVGRLDADTSGLLLFSRDGQVTQHLLHPRRAHPRTYRAHVDPTPDPALIAALTAGVDTAAGCFRAEGMSLHGDTIELTVREGKHRMVRRMLNNAGHPVVDLQRLAFGPFTLGPLASGAWRPPMDAEQAWLDALSL